jgi:hypothetical protein
MQKRGENDPDYGTGPKPLNQHSLELQQSWCRIVFLPLFDHSTTAVIRALATLRELGEIPEAAKTITENSCSERNFRPIRTSLSEVWIANVGIPSVSMDLVPRAPSPAFLESTGPCGSSIQSRKSLQISGKTDKRQIGMDGGLA